MILSTLATLAASEGVKAAVKPVFEKFIEPNLDNIKSWLKDRKISKKIESFEVEFINYLSNIYASTEFMNILIFPNEQISIDDFYEPLFITISNQKEAYRIGNTNLEFLTKYKNIIISDAAGMGKSTISKWIVRQCINKYLGIPILIELKKITKTNGITKEIFTQFGDLGPGFDEDFINKILSLGKFVIIFDGFDEIAQDNIDFALLDISDFISKLANNHFVLTSRPDPVLTTFGNFKGFTIRPLTEEQYTSIIYKCDKYSPDPIGTELVVDLQKRGQDIISFLANPFLVTLMYNCYSYNKNIPVNKSTFYDEIYTALFKRHDLSKNKFERIKRSKLDIYNFRLVLRKLAYNVARIGLNNYSEHELVAAIKDVQNSISGLPDFNAIDFCDDLIRQVPLMVRDGLHIKWSHKSLQDYFAAESICYNAKKAKIVKSIYNSDSFYKNANIFDFILELDYDVIRENILYNILLDFRDFVNQLRESNQFMEEKKIRSIASVLFGNYIVIAKFSNPEKVPFERLHEITDPSVMGFTSHKVRIDNKPGMILTTINKYDSLFNMMNKRKKDDLFIFLRNKKDNINFDLIGLPFMEKDIINISDEAILNSNNAGVENVISQIINNCYSGLVLDYDKAMLVLKDIEVREARNLDDDETDF